MAADEVRFRDVTAPARTVRLFTQSEHFLTASFYRSGLPMFLTKAWHVGSGVIAPVIPGDGVKQVAVAPLRVRFVDAVDQTATAGIVKIGRGGQTSGERTPGLG